MADVEIQSPKEIAWDAYWRGYKQGRNTESYSDIDRRTARENFERWWSRR